MSFILSAVFVFKPYRMIKVFSSFSFQSFSGEWSFKIFLVHLYFLFKAFAKTRTFSSFLFKAFTRTRFLIACHGEGFIKSGILRVFSTFIFLGGAPTSICHFFHLSISPSSSDHTFWHTYLKWWFFFFSLWFFKLLGW